MAISVVDAGANKVSRSAEVGASAETLFELLSDPHRHREVDGSGTVFDAVSGPHQLAEGDSFSVKMKQYGVPYRIKSRVTELVDGRVLEWRHPAGHRWRWEFQPSGEDSTVVTETFDYSTINGVQAKLLEVMGIPKQNAAGIESTLSKLQSRYAH